MTFNDELDPILDEALAEYRNAEPLGGLEDRVLWRVRQQAESQRMLWWRWSAIIAAAIVLAIVAWIGWSGRVRHKAIPSLVVQKEIPRAEPSPDVPSTRAAKVHLPEAPHAATKVRQQASRLPATVQLARVESAPMQEQFPSEIPPKAEERIWLALAQTHPETLRELARDDSDQELFIAPIKIKPLVDETNGNQGEN